MCGWSFKGQGFVRDMWYEMGVKNSITKFMCTPSLHEELDIHILLKSFASAHHLIRSILPPIALIETLESPYLFKVCVGYGQVKGVAHGDGSPDGCVWTLLPEVPVDSMRGRVTYHAS